MSTEYFVEETDDEGNKTYSKTEEVVNKDEITNIQTEHETLVNLLKDAEVEITDGKVVLPKSVKVEAVIVDKDVQVESVVEDKKDIPEPIDIEELTTTIITKVFETLNTAEVEKQKITTLLSEHKLPDSYRDILIESRNPESTAKVLGQAMLKMPDISGTGLDDKPDTVISALFGNVDKELGRVTKNE